MIQPHNRSYPLAYRQTCPQRQIPPVSRSTQLTRRFHEDRDFLRPNKASIDGSGCFSGSILLFPNLPRKYKDTKQRDPSIDKSPQDQRLPTPKSRYPPATYYPSSISSIISLRSVATCLFILFIFLCYNSDLMQHSPLPLLVRHNLASRPN